MTHSRSSVLPRRPLPALLVTLGALALPLAPAGAQTSISSGSYSGYVADASGSPYNISGGTFIGTPPPTSDGVGALTEDGLTQVNISGGDFSTQSLHAAAIIVDGTPDASLTISDGSFHDSSDGIYTDVPANVVITGGTFDNNTNHGLFGGAGTTAFISGGNFNGNGQGALYTQDSLFDVSGGNFTGGLFNILSDNGAANVYGGTFDNSGSAFVDVNAGAINLFGPDLAFSDGLGGASRNSGSGAIIGTLADGTTINAGYQINGPGTINLNPGTSAATAYLPSGMTTSANGTTYNFTNVSGGSVIIGSGTYLAPNGNVYTVDENPPANSIFIPQEITVLPGMGVNNAGEAVPLDSSGQVPGGGYVPNALVYVDPKTTYGYTYTMTGSSRFTEIGGLPTGFGHPFDITADGTDYGLFGPGQTLLFAGGGVSAFTISGIDPLVDGSDPQAFPFQVAFSTPTASFNVTPMSVPAAVPEPSSFALLLLGLLPVGLCARKRQKAA